MKKHDIERINWEDNVEYYKSEPDWFLIISVAAIVIIFSAIGLAVFLHG